MSQDKQTEVPIPTQMDKIHQYLLRQRKKKSKLNKLLKRTSARLEGALTEDPEMQSVHTRSFAFEKEQLEKELEQVVGKLTWATRTLRALDIKWHTKKVTITDKLDGEREEHTELVHRPFFEALRGLRLAR